MAPDRFATPTGEPCPRSLREDGSVDGAGDCLGCGFCLLVMAAAWPDAPPAMGDDDDGADSVDGWQRPSPM